MNFRVIAAAVASDISCGRLRPGERLPPQREFAYRNGIAPSTASRVYAELSRRGLVAGEVGRGTYVRSALGQPGTALTEPTLAPLDLEMNFPLLPNQAASLRKTLAAALGSGLIDQALQPVGAAATHQARVIAAGFLTRGRWKPDPDGILFTGNGRQAIAASMAAMTSPGSRIGVEALTYPVVKGIAAQLGVTLVPIRLDEKGLVPEALLQAHSENPLSAVYLQPSLHNPLGLGMDGPRRNEIAALLDRLDLIAIEDAIYSFLIDEEPLAAVAPDRVILIDSLSKRVAPGMTLGFVAAPQTLVARIATAVRAGAWSASGLPLTIGLQLIADGTADQIGNLKRQDAAARQNIARRALSGLPVAGDPRSYHLWLELSGALRAGALVAAAARQGIAISPGSVFAVAPGHAPNAVRLALSTPPRDALLSGLQALRQMICDGGADVE